MLKRISHLIFGKPGTREAKKYQKWVDAINDMEAQCEAMSQEAIQERVKEMRESIQSGQDIEDFLIEAYALVREASKRTIGLRHYDVQMIGGIILHKGIIAEMRTGEGKTLVATLPLFLNSLTGKGVHLITPNDYLSKVGLQQMGPVYHFLGVSAAVIQSSAQQRGSFIYDPDFHSDDDRYENLRPVSRPEAYRADVTYGTNNEFGFDYLRDNMVRDPAQKAQRGHNYAIVDEIDNILIDEARTPLIISGTAAEPSELYRTFTRIVRPLKDSSPESVELEEPDGDYVYDPKTKGVYLTEQGVEKVENAFLRTGSMQGDNLYSPENADVIPYLDNALRAKVVYQRDKEYIVDGGQVVIVDEFTGRLMYGRRFSEGLHQAIEAKENVEIQRENMTLGTVTFQNYFRMYDKLCGMTGTAYTSRQEFQQIYDLDVAVIPTNKPIQRLDLEDVIYISEEAKWDAVVEDIQGRQEKGQPVLVGTVAVETSEYLSSKLNHAGVEHEVLNAKQHFREAEIIAQAGRPGAVTIATNMAGRGVDILLGGNAEGLARSILRKKYAGQGLEITEVDPKEWEEVLQEARAKVQENRKQVLEAGGLYVLGTERHDARRIDNQLRGRSGRQGDPGESLFYLSLEDELMKRFGAQRVKNFMQWADIPPGQPLRHKWISNSIAQAQTRVEGYYFDIRKRVLEYDDVVDRQRKALYKQRDEILFAEPGELRGKIQQFVADEISDLCKLQLQGEEHEWTPEMFEELYRQALTIYPVPPEITPETLAKLHSREDIENELLKGALKAYENKIEEFEGADNMGQIEKLVILQVMDNLWVRHLTDLDVLREGIGLQAIRQRDPLVEYRIEGYQMWEALNEEIQSQVARTIYRAIPKKEFKQPKVTSEMQATVTSGGSSNGKSTPEPVRASTKDKLGRNDECWCGSGKKYKHCHYREDQKERQLARPGSKR